MGKEADSISFHVIGHVRSNHAYPWQLPRQAVLAKAHTARIEFDTRIVGRDALKDLEGFDRVWIVFVFHKAGASKQLVSPPGIGRKHIGVFATRSPHRLNPIGISCVKLVSIGDTFIDIEESDMMDGSPVLDIKPYMPYADSFTDASVGWTHERELETWTISIAETAQVQLRWILENIGLDLTSAIHAQLSDDPFNSRRKRVERIEQGRNVWILACRTWRISFEAREDQQSIVVLSVKSGYTSEELAATEDKHSDKLYHREFTTLFPQATTTTSK